MKLDIAKTNYLQIPLIEEYYALTKVLNPYRQIEFNINAKRSLYEDILDRFQPFSNIEDIEKSIEILDNTVFLHQKKIKKIPLSLPEDKIVNLNSKGFNLLGLNMPFSNKELGKAYLSTIQKYHSIDGENNKDINNAYLLYRNFLSFEEYIKNKGSKAGYFNISNGKDFYISSYVTLLKIYIDIWELDKSYKMLTYILNSEFVNYGLFDDKDDELSWLLKIRITELTQKLIGVGKFEIATSLVEKIDSFKCNDFKPKYILYPPYNCDNTKKQYVKDLKKIINDKSKYSIRLMHESQAKYAFKNNVITEKRYKDAMKRFSVKEERIDISQKVLDVWLEKNSFLQLPFDQKLEYTEVGDFSSYFHYSAHKNIYRMTKQQQSEYYLTFYMEPTIKLIDRYLYFRVYSYIFSLKEYKEKESYLTIIINECHLFLKLYENSPIPKNSHMTSLVIGKFIEYLIEFSESTKNNHEEKFNKLKKPPENWWPLSMDCDLRDPYSYAPWTQKKIHIKSQMSQKELYDELTDQYNSHEYSSELIESFDYLHDLGEMLCSEKYGRNIKLATEVFNIVVEQGYIDDDSSIALDIIKNIASSDCLNDKEWAKEIYLKVQSTIEEHPDNLVTCAELITKDEYFGDKNWGKEIIQKTLDEASETELILIADIVASSDGLNDKEWAKDITSLVQKVPDNFLDLILLGEKLAKKDGLNDIEGARNIAIEAAKKCEGAGCLAMIAEYVMNNLNDSVLANKITNMPLKEVKMTTVKFTVNGGKDDKTDEYLKNIVEDDTYYELKVRSGEKIEDVLSGIVRNEKFMKDVLYSKWNTILKPEFDIVGEYDSALYIDKLIYEGITYNNDYELSPGWSLHVASRMVFGFKQGTVSNLDY